MSTFIVTVRTAAGSETSLAHATTSFGAYMAAATEQGDEVFAIAVRPV